MTSQSPLGCTICFLFFLKKYRTHRTNAIKRFLKDIDTVLLIKTTLQQLLLI